MRNEKLKRRDRQPADLMALLVLSEMLADDPPTRDDPPLPDQTDAQALATLPTRKL
jgi:hypothetical protein